MTVRRKLAYAAAIVIASIMRAVVWIINQGPFMPPFGGSRSVGHKKRANDGDYQYQFCPHCGSWIPHRYTVLTDALPGDMKAYCPECGRTSSVSVIGKDSTDTCDHSALKSYDKQDRRDLLLEDEPVDCPDCGTTFIARRDHFAGDIYLIKQEVA